MKYIDKDVVAAKIKKIKSYIGSDKYLSDFEKGCNFGREDVCDSLLNFLDSLEVKDVDLENSMICKVGWYDGPLLDYTQEQQDELLDKIGADVGDKIRVILIKE